MQGQNKQLKRILDQMIKLIKNNKKVPVSNNNEYGNIRNGRNSQDIINNNINYNGSEYIMNRNEIENRNVKQKNRGQISFIK